MLDVTITHDILDLTNRDHPLPSSTASATGPAPHPQVVQTSVGYRKHVRFERGKCASYWNVSLLSIEWNSIRLGGPAHGIVTKTVHKTLPGGGGVQGGGGGPVGGWVGDGGVQGWVGRGWWGPVGRGGGVQGWVGRGDGGPGLDEWRVVGVQGVGR